ncbi:hypothetical protein D9M70_456690 [compost metagenome]
MTTAKLGLTETANGQANYLNVNESLARLDQLVQAAVLDKDLSTQPGSPANGALYIVGASPTGAWSGKAGQLAYWLSGVGAWTFVVPREGMLVHVNDEDAFYKFDGSAWSIFTASGMANPMTTSGDLIVGGTAGAAGRLGIGTEGQVLTVASGVPAWAAADSGLTLSSKSAAYTLVLADANLGILHPSADTTARTFTIPGNASVEFPVGTAVTFINQNGAGVVTITITSDTLRLAGDGSTGDRTLAANGLATALKIAANEWIISGVGLT